MNDKWFLSSNGSQDLSLSIKGFLTFLVPLVAIAFKYAGHEIPQPTLEAIVIQGGLVVSSAITFYGLLRKLYYLVKDEVK